MNIAIYRTNDGYIERFVSCPPDHVDLQLNTGEEYFLNCPTTATHIINNEPITQAPPPPTLQELIRQYTQAVQKLLDSTAQQRNYDSILSACTYATSTNIKFKTEGQACVVWRDEVWGQFFTVIDQANNGAPLPALTDLLASLPKITWPPSK